MASTSQVRNAKYTCMSAKNSEAIVQPLWENMGNIAQGNKVIHKHTMCKRTSFLK